MERLDFSEKMAYNAIEAAIHMNRYLSAREYVQGKRVLDVACGEGYGTRLLKEWGAAEVVGVDISAAAIAKAQHNFGGEGIAFLKHSCEELPFEADSFDVVVSFETIEHVDDPDQFLREIVRVLRFNGTAVISCPNDYVYEEHVQGFQNPYHKHKWHYFEFKELSEKYLGNGADWFMGFALNGYTNIPVEDCTQPEENALPTSMLAMMQYQDVHQAVQVKAERYLNHWNCNYYLGVWNGKRQNIRQAVLFAREFFVDPTDPAYVSVQDAFRTNQEALASVQQEYTDQLRTVTAENRELKRKMHVMEVEQERTSQLLRLAEEEKGFLWNRINGTEGMRAEMDRMREEYDYFQQLKGYRAYKAMQLYYRIKDKIKHLFRK